MPLILLTLALLLFLLAGASPWPEPWAAWRLRLIAFGLAAYVAASYPWPK